MSIASKAQTFVWYLKQPPLHRELIRKVVGRRFTTRRGVKESERQRDEGRAWCKQNECSYADLMRHLGLPENLGSLQTLHPEAYRLAEQTVAAAPVTMGGPANLDLLYHLVKHLQVDTVIETGVAAGWSTLAILLALEENKKGHLHSVDMPYAKLGNEDFVGCAVPDRLKHRWTLVRRPDRDALPAILEAHPVIDLAHYDSDKTAEGRMFAYERLWKALREGGILMSDDIEDNAGFRTFASQAHRKPWIFRKPFPGNFAGLLIK